MADVRPASEWFVPVEVTAGDTRSVAVAPLVVSSGLVAVLLVLGRVEAATILALVVVMLVHLQVAAPVTARRLQSTISHLAAQLAHAIGWVLLGLLSLLVFLPASLLLWILRLIRQDRAGGSGAWTQRPARTAHRVARTFGYEPRPMARGRSSLPVRVAAALALLVVVDLAVGAVLAGTRVLRPIDRGDIRTSVMSGTISERSSPVFADEPWATELGRDMVDYELAEREYEPYLVRTQARFESEYVNTTTTERRSYNPTEPTLARPLKVAFLGGSVMFGMGQRDEHTIPSAIARLAEDAGVPVEVHNYGVPGWIAWQEALYLERLLASGERYDLVVFLDGFNEFGVQQSGATEDPTHHGAATLQQLLAEFDEQRQEEPDYLDGFAEVARTYRRNSAALRLFDSLAGREVPLVPENPGDGADQQAAALEVYGRSVDLASGIAEGGDTEVMFFWQPRQDGWSDEIIRALPDEVVDVSDAFGGDGSDVFYDHVHTNEAGAAELGAAMWRAIEPRLMEGRTPGA